MKTNRICDQVRENRIRLDLTQRDLAEKIYTSPQAISNIERGCNKPSYKTAQLIDSVIGTDLATSLYPQEGGHLKEKKLTALQEIKDFDAFEENIDFILSEFISINDLPFSASYMGRSALFLLCAYLIYFTNHTDLLFEGETDWFDIARALRELVDRTEDWYIPQHEDEYPFIGEDILYKKVEWLYFVVDEELQIDEMEDSDVCNPFHDYIKEVAVLGDVNGKDLLSLLPNESNPHRTDFIMSVIQLSDIIYALAPEIDGRFPVDYFSWLDDDDDDDDDK